MDKISNKVTILIKQNKEKQLEKILTTKDIDKMINKLVKYYSR